MRQILDILRGSTTFEAEKLADGTLLIGKMPRRKDGLFQEAYLHEIYAPLGLSQIDSLETLIGKRLPKALRELYEQANGLSLFYGSFSIRGLRANYNRRDGTRQPVSLEYGNTMEIPTGEGDTDRIVFGFYAIDDGYQVSILPRQGDIVELTPRRRNSPRLAEWRSISEFLLSEVERLSMEFEKAEGACDPLNVLPAPTSGANK